ncbi:MAG TPA: thioredoxin domain-containing protein [Candidatus Paceibacterota bacterium]
MAWYDGIGKGEMLMALVLPLSYQNFDKHVLAVSVPVIVVCGVPRCSAYQELLPVLEEIAHYLRQHFGNCAAFFSLDVDQYPKLCLSTLLNRFPQRFFL